MVHSGPFNGLCEIESSRGSPGISNIFLPMPQLLRTTPLPPPSPSHPPLPSHLVVPPTADSCTSLPLPSYVRRKQHPPSPIDPRRSSRSSFAGILSTSCRGFAADANGFPNFRGRESTNGRAHETLPEFFRPHTAYSSHNFCSGCEKKRGEGRRYLDP